ncbi:MAG: polysaccharide deacetylase family protein [Bacteroidota bacterium]
MIDPIPPDRFERQMRHLARAYRPLPLPELLQRSREGTVPKGAVAVTFDDGYADNADHALPILARHRIPATIFLATGCIGTGRILWHDEVLLAFAGSDRCEIRLAGAPPEAPALPLRTEAERHRAAFIALAELKPLPEGERLARIRALQEELGRGDSAISASLMLDWDRVRAMRRAGVDFGSHTVTHPILSRVTPEREREELIDSKHTLERELGEEITLFAYPNGRPGDFSERTVAALRAAGYGGAVTTIFGVNESGEDPLRCRRASAWMPDDLGFALQIAYYRLRGVGAVSPSMPDEAAYDSGVKREHE